ncbi:MAG: NAD(P)-dependent oxidoreductase [Erysipelotrichaceae bacterium]
MKLLATRFRYLDDAFCKQVQDMGYDVTWLEEGSQNVEHPETFEVVMGTQRFEETPIHAFSSLKAILTYSVGIEHLDLDYLQAHNIALYNAKDVYSVAIAEWCVGRILDCFKQVPFYLERQHQHDWHPTSNMRSLKNANVLLVGYGNISKAIVKRLVGFDAQIQIVNRTAQSGVEDLGQLDSYLPHADVVIVALALHEQTKQLFDAKRLGALKKGAVFVNVARGGLVDEQALVEAALRKQNWFVLDVFEEEPLPMSSKLWNLDHVLLTPHISYQSDYSMQRLKEHLLDVLETLQRE